MQSSRACTAVEKNQMKIAQFLRPKSGKSQLTRHNNRRKCCKKKWRNYGEKKN